MCFRVTSEMGSAFHPARPASLASVMTSAFVLAILHDRCENVLLRIVLYEMMQSNAQKTDAASGEDMTTWSSIELIEAGL